MLIIFQYDMVLFCFTHCKRHNWNNIRSLIKRVGNTKIDPSKLFCAGPPRFVAPALPRRTRKRTRRPTSRAHSAPCGLPANVGIIFYHCEGIFTMSSWCIVTCISWRLYFHYAVQHGFYCAFVRRPPGPRPAVTPPVRDGSSGVRPSGNTAANCLRDKIM